MYQIKCDNYILYDPRDEDLVVLNPKCNLDTNKVGEASFKIERTHPHFDQLQMLKSVFEISDEYGVIFRGRMTENSRDLSNGKVIDLEGVLAFFNDSVVRPYKFPDNYLADGEYIAASEHGNVVAFWLGKLIENHNSQVQDFQKFKLGNVTVVDPNNYITRADSNYSSTWDVLEDKLFNSALGGFLCIRYEADGNYIDYLAEFTETNPQGIVFGENLLDLTQNINGTDSFSAIIPLGARVGEEQDAPRLTIGKLGNRNITDDIVKQGDTIYSISAVSRYGWRYAPIEDTTWDDVTAASNLERYGVEALTLGMHLADTVEVSAVDLHFTDKQIRSFRVYQKIPVKSAPHGLDTSYNLTKLTMDLANPQNTVITVGASQLTLTEYQKDETRFIIQRARDEINVSLGDKATKAELSMKVDRTDNSQVVSMINAAADVIDLDAKRFSIGDKTGEGGSGKICGWEITGDYIRKDNAGLLSSQNQLGKYTYGSTAPLRFYAGLEDLGSFDTAEMTGLINSFGWFDTTVDLPYFISPYVDVTHTVLSIMCGNTSAVFEEFDQFLVYRKTPTTLAIQGHTTKYSSTTIKVQLSFPVLTPIWQVLDDGSLYAMRCHCQGTFLDENGNDLAAQIAAINERLDELT